MEERPGVPPAPAPSWPGSSASDSNPPSRRESGSVVTSIRRVRNSYSAAAGEKDNSLRVSHSSPLGNFIFDTSKPNCKAKTGRARVLCADKNGVIRAVMENHLANSYDLVVSASAKEALRALDADDVLPDVMIIDLDLPDMKGEDVIGVIRYYIPATRIPIIAIGKHGTTTRLIQCMKNGAQDYIFKPPRSDELLTKIETQLRLVDSIRLEAEGNILRRILPEYIIERLHSSSSAIADNHESLTFMFADLCNFTEMCGRTETSEVVAFLNDLYTSFDKLVDRNGVYKVDIIGDAYMCVSGHEEASRRHHASAMLNMALDMLEVASAMVLPAPTKGAANGGPQAQLPVRLRIGIHSGPASAGVIGEKCPVRFASISLPRYTFFGDTVNVASRMESHGAPMTIHLSQDCLTELLKEGWDTEDFVAAGETVVKGKGKMNTYFVKAGEYEKAVGARLSKQTTVSKLRFAADRLFHPTKARKRPSIGSGADIRLLLGPEELMERERVNAEAQAQAEAEAGRGGAQSPGGGYEAGAFDVRRRSMSRRMTHDGSLAPVRAPIRCGSVGELASAAAGAACPPSGKRSSATKRSTIDEAGLESLRQTKTAPRGILRTRPASNPALPADASGGGRARSGNAGPQRIPTAMSLPSSVRAVHSLSGGGGSLTSMDDRAYGRLSDGDEFAESPDDDYEGGDGDGSGGKGVRSPNEDDQSVGTSGSMGALWGLGSAATGEEQLSRGFVEAREREDDGDDDDLLTSHPITDR